MKKYVNPSCIVQVGDGRGFIIEQRIRIHPRNFRGLGKVRLRTHIERRLVLTAAHCLPKLPPACTASYTQERTYENLLGQLHGKRTVWAECLFVDPIADIAVLGCPDGQIWMKEWDGYGELTDDAPVLLIGKAQSGRGWLLALDGVHWVPTKVDVTSCSSGAFMMTGPVEPGMSGSPILDDLGCAIGVAVIGSDTVEPDGNIVQNEECGPQAILAFNLPGWLLGASNVKRRMR